MNALHYFECPPHFYNKGSRGEYKELGHLNFARQGTIAQ
jgi:hypothetical protein